MVVVDKERVDMEIPESSDSRVVKDLSGYKINDENFVGVGEIMVTITLKEYRSLVGIAATVETIKSEATGRALKAEIENADIKKENASLKQENYDLQKTIEQLKEQSTVNCADKCVSADEQEEE